MTNGVTRRAALVSAGAGVTALSGCLGDRGIGSAGSASPTDSPNEGDGSSDRSATERSGPPTRDETLPLPMDASSLRNRAISGGPPKDGIPAIDDPQFVTAAAAAERLNPGDPVFGLVRGDAIKAYPQSILVSHEICNDVVDGVPVSVTYCPLTGTAMGFERGDTTFGVSGRLVNNNLIMYDRATETWWPQVLATAIPGPWNESPATRSLREFRLIWTTWERWVDRHPDTRVLSRETGFARNYDTDPYGTYNPRLGYYEPESSPMFPPLASDERLEPKRVVIGARTTAGAFAVEKNRLRDAKLVHGDLAGTSVVATYDPNLDTGYVFSNPDARPFDYRRGRVHGPDGGTHPPADLPLERLLAFDAMWFAWRGFYPETTLYD
ncbi:DUF3179 domain-containing (seleno)protein [Halopenitus persicus]|uniref:DUF3179 domain-containing protein n=1 Tax=Halopenitus persicus TaxID=1048396 RepID=A0A1H3FML6_9EURY|nr:DUF3179 domain-containing (seleno)protein [Halopenitus persicus]SDX91628.1 Protein of unknown function [Halopenitus persicus]